MELLKDRIMILINSNKPYRLDIRKIADKLGMESTADFIMLNKALNSLEEEYVLDRNEDNCFASFEKSGLVKGFCGLTAKASVSWMMRTARTATTSHRKICIMPSTRMK